MSTLRNKSVSQQFSKYFEAIGNLEKNSKRYLLDKGKIVSTKNSEKPWDLGKAGVPIFWDEKENAVGIDHSDSHTLVVGPTGSKKSRLVVMPLVRILGSAGESMIISDPKAEIYNRTVSYLEEKGYNISVLNLRSPLHGMRWNPLAIPYDFFLRGEIDKAYEFVNDIAENLIHTEQSQNDPFWDNSAGSFFFGLVLLLFKYCKDFNKDASNVHIGNVIKLRNDLFSNNRMGINPLWEYAKKDPIITSALIGTVETAKDTRGGILSTFDQKVRIFSIQPNLQDMLLSNEIDFDTIDKKPTAIYLIVPDEKTGYHGLVSLFIKQSYEYMIYKAQVSSKDDGFHLGRLENRVNYVLDEFSSLPTIHDFPAMITAARSRNIRFTLVIQSKHQLIQRYKDETDTIQSNCSNWIFLTSRELQLLEEISSICGKTTEGKPVISVASLQRLDKDEGEALLLHDRAKPCITILPDIEKYELNYPETKVIEGREIKDIELLDFYLPFPSSKIREPVNIDDLIKRIDKQIAELEDKEKQEKNGDIEDDADGGEV